jgi:hypothetical protein
VPAVRTFFEKESGIFILELKDPAAKPAPDQRPLWLPLHSAAAAKPPGERTTPREFPFISDLFFLALLLIN